MGRKNAPSGNPWDSGNLSWQVDTSAAVSAELNSTDAINFLLLFTKPWGTYGHNSCLRVPIYYLTYYLQVQAPYYRALTVFELLGDL
jgi:hypothetical protein